MKEQPLCIYVYFKGAQWQIHPGLPRGVLPLTPVKRSWALNRNKKEPRIDRCGFTLLPDYACTAHMVQGMTLEGLLADCGDILDHPRDDIRRFHLAQKDDWKFVEQVWKKRKE